MNVKKLSKAYRTEIIAAALLLILLAQLLYIISSTSMIMDEQFYPGVGKYTVTTGEYTPFAYRYHPALPYFINSIFLYTDGNPVWQQRPFDMFSLMNAYGVDYFLFVTRLPIALVTVLLGIFVFLWARELYGDKAAIFSLALLTFEPTLIANGAVATTDAVAATFTFISMYFLWKLSKKRTTQNYLLAGFFLGLALLSKFTSVILVPLAILIFALYFRPIKPNMKNFIVYFLVAFLVIWAFYGFETRPMIETVHSKERALEFLEQRFPDNGTRQIVLNAMSTPIPASTYFNGALGYSLYSSTEGFPTLFFGQYIHPKYPFEFWHYHLFAFLIKEPIPLLAFIAIFSLLAIKGLQKIERKNEKFLALPIIFIFVLFSFFVNIKIGLRHLLPLYPFVFVLLGKITTLKIKNKRSFSRYKLLLAIFLVWYVIEAILIIPNNMAYFNQLVGGDGHKYLTDSNIDWGQGVKQLKTYLEENDIENPYVDVMLPKKEFVSYYIEEFRNPSCSPVTGLHAVGVSKLNFYDRECLSWLNSYTPAAIIGRSIFLYNITSVV